MWQRVSECIVVCSILVLVHVARLPHATADQQATGANASKPQSTAATIHPALVQVKEDPSLPRVLVIGDSISMGYLLPLREKLKSKANLQHPTENCGSTKRILEHLDQYLGDNRWDVILFNSGIHDLTLLASNGKAATESDGGTPQVPLDVYRKNLEELITRLRPTGAKLIWCTTTPVTSAAKFRRPKDVEQYNVVAEEVMKRHGIKTIDLHRLVQKQESQLLTEDGVHFTTDGYQVLADHLFPIIEDALAKQPR